MNPERNYCYLEYSDNKYRVELCHIMKNNTNEKQVDENMCIVIIKLKSKFMRLMFNSIFCGC